MMQDSAMTDQQ